MTETSSIWLRPERGTRGPASRWSRTQMTATAIAQADEHGLAAVTMRSVAQTMGTAPASLYRVVKSRQELVELMVDEVIGEFTYPPELVGSGPLGLLALSRQARIIYLRHPWMVEAHAHQPVLGPNAIAYLDWALSTLKEAPHSSRDKLETIGVLSALVRMLAGNELEHDRAGRASRDWQEATAAHLASQAREGEHPHVAAALLDSRAGATEPPDLFDRIVIRTIAGLLPAT